MHGHSPMVQWSTALQIPYLASYHRPNGSTEQPTFLNSSQTTYYMYILPRKYLTQKPTINAAKYLLNIAYRGIPLWPSGLRHCNLVQEDSLASFANTLCGFIP